MSEPTPRRVILCPLNVEANALRRAGLADPIRLCGPGEDAIEKAILSEVQRGDASRLVLAGLAGGISRGVRSEQAHWISRVVTPDGHPVGEDLTLAPGAMKRALCVCTVGTPVSTPQAKQALHEASGADLVDLESRRFVEICQREGLDWAILRGVSDDAKESLPPGSERLVDARGHARPGRVMAALAVHPWRIPGVIKLARTASRAMAKVASELKATQAPAA